MDCGVRHNDEGSSSFRPPSRNPGDWIFWIAACATMTGIPPILIIFRHSAAAPKSRRLKVLDSRLNRN